MPMLISLILGCLLIFGPIFIITKIAEKVKPNATVGEVGPYIIGVILLELIILLALVSG